MCKLNSIKRLVRVIVIGLTVTLINPCFLLSQNLVPNYSFEILDSCPNAQGQLSFAQGWINPQTDVINTPDLFTSCAVVGIKTPVNFIGYCVPKTDSSYIGLGCFVRFQNYNNVREYAEIQLSQALIAGEQYYLEMNINCGDFVGFAQNLIGMVFSDTLYINPTYEYFPLPTAIEYAGPPILDTATWTTVNGVYTANGNENFLLLGCFKPDSLLLLDSINVGFPGGGGIVSYYYFDDIKVIPLDSLQGIDEPISNLSVNVYPNPAKEWLTLDFNSNIQKQLNVSLFSMDGKEIKSWSEEYTSKIYLTLPQLSNGIYFLKFRNGGGEVVRKVVIR
jgi:hypothetical protein